MFVSSIPQGFSYERTSRCYQMPTTAVERFLKNMKPLPSKLKDFFKKQELHDALDLPTPRTTHAASFVNLSQTHTKIEDGHDEDIMEEDGAKEDREASLASVSNSGKARDDVDVDEDKSGDEEEEEGGGMDMDLDSMDDEVLSEIEQENRAKTAKSQVAPSGLSRKSKKDGKDVKKTPTKSAVSNDARAKVTSICIYI